MNDTHKNIKETYNTLVGEKLDGAYEHDRWFKTPVQKLGHTMTSYAITKHVIPYIDQDTHTVLELGPGPGTWTKLILQKAQNAHIDLVDISKEMLIVAAKELSQYSNQITYTEIDFLDFELTQQYDVFFSSRAIEYIQDKPAAVAKIAQSLRSGGQGYIITKTPHYTRQKMLGKAVPDMHKNQISPEELKELLQNNGCIDIAMYPVVMSCYYSIFKSLKLNQFFHKVYRDMQLNSISKHFSESYLITFHKQ